MVDKASRKDELLGLQKRIAELEQAVGQKQMKIDYYEKFIELASEEVGQDLKKKKYARAASSGSSSTNKA